MGRKVYNGAVSAAATVAAAGINSGAAHFMVRQYDGGTDSPLDKLVGDDNTTDIFFMEEGRSCDRYFYYYPSYSHSGSVGSTQGITATIVSAPSISGLTITDTGNAIRIYGTPSTGTNNTYQFTFKMYNIGANTKWPDGTARERVITVKLRILPQNSSPLWTAPDSLTEVVPRNQTDFTLITAPTAAAWAGTTYSLSGTYPTWMKIDRSTGRVFAASVPDLTEVSGTTYNFTITATITADGVTRTKSFTRVWRVNDPWGAMYWGPGSLMSNNWSSWGDQRSSSDTGLKYGTSIFNANIKSGALQNTNRSYDTSPYWPNSGYGLNYSSSFSWSSGSTGYLSTIDSNGYTNGQHTQNNLSYCYRFMWKVPAGVTKIAIAAIGGGAGGSYSWASGGGGGGGMAWVNDVTVTPGEELEIVVGRGGAYHSSDGSYWGGVSYVRRNSPAEYFVVGYGGGYQNGHSIDYVSGSFPNTTFSGTASGRSNPQASGMYFVENYNYNDSRDSGSAATSTRYGTYGANYGGQGGGRNGGGAAGYQGRGGNNQERGYGGGGGGGYYYSSTYGVSGGGGVGLDGQGSSGPYSDGSGNAGGDSNQYGYGQYSWAYTGGGGSGGARGARGENPFYGSGESQSNMQGGQHGAGGGGSGTSQGGGHGAMGGVRIIWGNNPDGTPRRFPNSGCSEDPAYINLSTSKP